jgi:hypothetical protein
MTDFDFEIGLPGSKRNSTMRELFMIEVERAVEEFDVDRKTIGDADAIVEFTRKLRKLGFYPREIYYEIEKVMS